MLNKGLEQFELDCAYSKTRLEFEIIISDFPSCTMATLTFSWNESTFISPKPLVDDTVSCDSRF